MKQEMQLVIFGAGKLAEFIHFSFTYDSPYEVVAFCVEDAYLPESKELLGIPAFSSKQLLQCYSPEDCQVHIAIGRNNVRARVFQQ